MLNAVAGKAMLTVSEMPGFLAAGGMILLKDVDNRLRFDMNLPAVQQADLRVGTDALELADSVTSNTARSMTP